MTALRHLKLSNGKAIDIATEIGNSYEKVGDLLLDDSVVQNIWTNKKEVVATNAEILRTWLRGSGKQPVTWRTLIEVLEASGINELSKDIVNALLSKS